MHVILTHEQADFDAIASQLGAYLLDKRAIPVLPTRINRNVRAFLTIYGAEFPYVERRDLPGDPIDVVTLVDTQSMISLKKMSSHLRVQIVDHHKRRPDLPEDWHLTIQPTGAAATLFVEALQERGLPISHVQATLLLLGIYEDTGSLTYTRTTVRDMRASAFLMDCGASLQIVGDYLNHPLSLTQQSIYEKLRDFAETHTIHGHTVIIACGEAIQTHEELSSIAHKLRDLLEPDALILLMEIRGGVQMIGRSTNDHIDVAEIAAHFGGGGHSRAAAGLIKDRSLPEIRQDLIESLPDFVHPAVTVGNIMSRDPQLITPETPVEHVAERMQRFGYEGYPVVQDGAVVGLLTRRAVDRAVSHKLNVPAGTLMEVGEVHVKPDDPIEHLQHVMTDSGWGQVPVQDPDTGVIIGIVTRTDLLKTLAPQPTIPGHQNLANRLERAMPPGHLSLLKAAAAEAYQMQQALYIVGGFVRDLILERPSLDFDLVVEGNAIDLAKALVKKYGGRITTHRRFGTAKWFLEADKFQIDEPKTEEHIGSGAVDLPSTIDLITARTEFYTYPTALPTVERGSIKLDLHRRDFTINTLALRLDGPHYGDMHDYWGGFSDLSQGLIRVLHSLSFVDDPTRMLRAVRFEQRFDFQIEWRTQELLQAARVLLKRVSGDRIRHELDFILDEEQAPAMLDRLSELGLLETIHPNLDWNESIKSKISNLSPPPLNWGIEAEYKGVSLSHALAYTGWFLHFPAQTARSIAKRLKISKALERVILDACSLYITLPKLQAQSPSTITRHLDGLEPLAIYVIIQTAADEDLQSNLKAYLESWRRLKPQTTGHDLRASGIPPGPVYKEILTSLRNAWLDGEIQSKEEEFRRFQNLIDAYLAEQGE